MSKWEKLKEVLNSYEIGEPIQRMDLVKEVEGSNRSKTYIDTLRRCLVVCGYLDDTHCAGVYILKRKLEPDLTSTQLRKRYSEELPQFYTSEARIEWYEKHYTQACKRDLERIK